MRRALPVMVVLALTLGAWLEAAAGRGQSDLVVRATGADVGGEPMTLSCDLGFASLPSNLFVGECRITVGRDHVSLGGMEADGVLLLTVVLSGELTVHGVAQAGSGRFSQVVSDGTAGFPMWIEIDPLSRAWVIRGDAPDGARQTLGRGSLSEGLINLAVPASPVPLGPEAGAHEEPRAPSPRAR